MLFRSKRIRLKHVGPTLDEEQFNQLEGLICTCGPFPKDYRAFLRAHNGGEPEPAWFRWTHPNKGERASRLYEFFHLNPGPFDRPFRRTDLMTVTLAYRQEMPQFSIPIAGVDDDGDRLIIFTHGPREGQVWIKVWDEVSWRMEDPWNPEEGLYRVAGTFIDLLRLLHETPVGDSPGDSNHERA